ncbi:phosphatidylinositol-4-phosphate 5-kinase [Cyanidioschyzon merolae strain 10D]|jgi:1-phosphatidylinositol-4-phosphate 5-kinase|uniref:Phosphatidylinositol-4-phosphate 5-kinase n=1 Tax=Cyanidioschyzon merolae (strain NIES-3377 / 10D) TaxID=280699 RepID=M1VAZ2_CYAM1|nr:phosphatidylinositol-4-phosphate 5-kinase [Cyanidioschyzon merolae strain 10D]BAM79367.1 phosphatidylinositol-4-phosphate 5-kinase [Cyanidioschyzon merolae strain 10D]|eukprot:XP_005535653.1 phosphatidylinositol-4-phosphate 5-kinase [Cyanidioschyzon merolae strain 10D]
MKRPRRRPWSLIPAVSGLLRGRGTHASKTRSNSVSVSNVDADENQSPSTCEAVFRVRSYTIANEDIILLGSCESLGCWDAERAVALETSPSTYPVWEALVELPVNTRVRYEYAKRVYDMDREQLERIVRERHPQPGRFIDTGNEGGFWLIDDGHLRNSYFDDPRSDEHATPTDANSPGTGGDRLCSTGARRVQYLGLDQLTQAFEREYSLSEQVNLREDFLRTFQRLGVFRIGSRRSLPTFLRGPLQPKVMRRNKSGITVFKDNPSWFIALNIQAGVRRSLQVLHEQERQQRNAPLQDADFVAAFVCHVEAGDRVREVPNRYIEPLSDSIKWEFSAPRVFARLRRVFGYTDDEFLGSLCNPAGLVEIPSPGNSQALFFLTHDQQFLLKTITRQEYSKLIQLLPAYFAYVSSDPLGTLLPQYLALFQIRTRQRHHIRFVVVPDLFPSAFRLHEKYDLKGSRRSKPRPRSLRSLPQRYKKKASASLADARTRSSKSPAASNETGTERPPLHLQVPQTSFVEHEWSERIAFSQLVAVPIFREDDIRSPFLIRANDYTILMRMIERDTAFLEELHIMDYSLLIGLSEPIPAPLWKRTHSATHEGRAHGSEIPFADETQKQSLPVILESTNTDQEGLLLSTVSPLAKLTLQLPGSTPGMAPQSPTLAQRITDATEDKLLFRDLIAFRREAGNYVGYKLRLGIIDALQDYSVPKRLEFGWKLFIYCGAAPSVCPPAFYRRRFLQYMQNVFVPYNPVELPIRTSRDLDGSNGSH